MAALTALPGVGRKTANVVLGHALGVAGLPVDRHVLRVGNRIGFAESDDPETVEQQLCGALPARMWTLASDVLILHGRRVCRPTPLCEECSVREYCDFYRHVLRARPPAATKSATETRARAATRTAATKTRATKAAATKDSKLTKGSMPGRGTSVRDRRAKR